MDCRYILKTPESADDVLWKPWRAPCFILGIDLGTKDSESGGYIIAEIHPNGALYRTMHSSERYRTTRPAEGNIILAIGGHDLTKLNRMNAQVVIWSTCNMDGDIRWALILQLVSVYFMIWTILKVVRWWNRIKLLEDQLNAYVDRNYVTNRGVF